MWLPNQLHPTAWVVFILRAGRVECATTLDTDPLVTKFDRSLSTAIGRTNYLRKLHDTVTFMRRTWQSMYDHFLCYLLAVCLGVLPLIACFRWSYLTTTEKVRIICAHHIHIPCARDIAGCYMFRNRLVTYMHVLHTIYSMLPRSLYDVEHIRIWCAYGESA